VTTLLADRGVVAAVVEFARREPGKVLTAVLGLHLLAWTTVPILVSPNLQLDLVEDLALGKEWQLGYWKGPPLAWWVGEAAYRLTGQFEAVYALGALAVVISLHGVWLLARETIGAFEGLIAVLALEGVHYYNFSAVKFNTDQMQLPFRAFTGLFFYRAIKRSRALDWTLAGAFLRWGVLVKICCFRIGINARDIFACRFGGAGSMAHARTLFDGARICGGNRAERVVADPTRLPAVSIGRHAREDRRPLVSVRHLSAVMDR
jgi:Dolichyl-phosphate-mannose-protein mannosyltransferase